MSPVKLRNLQLFGVLGQKMLIFGRDKDKKNSQSDPSPQTLTEKISEHAESTFEPCACSGALDMRTHVGRASDPLPISALSVPPFISALYYTNVYVHMARGQSLCSPQPVVASRKRLECAGLSSIFFSLVRRSDNQPGKLSPPPSTPLEAYTYTVMYVRQPKLWPAGSPGPRSSARGL